MRKNKLYESRIPYCESPALGMGAPICSKDCCNFGNCHKSAYFKFLAENTLIANHTKTKTAISTNWQFDKFIIDDREYNKEEVYEILKKHKEEEDKKYNICERCNKRYLENKTFNMVDCNLEEKLDNCSAWGYTSTPYIRGFKILSTCGHGREIKLCDDCIFELKKWLTKIKKEI